jgi:type IV secretory pathway VirB6-like protein
MRRLKLSLIFLLLPLLLSACDDPNPRCIEADDWGYPKVYVPARPDHINGAENRQFVDWIDSGQVILNATNNHLITRVNRAKTFVNTDGTITKDRFICGKDEESQPEECARPDRWTSWFNGNKDFVPIKHFCRYSSGSTSTTTSTAGIVSDDPAPSIIKVRADLNSSDLQTYCSQGSSRPHSTPDSMLDCRAPCWLKDGYGLYLLHTQTDTNSGNTRHLGDTDNDGYLTRELPKSLGMQTGERLYFKILDRYYTDNAGGYTVHLVEGTRSPNRGPLETVADIFITPTLVLMRRLYEGLIADNAFFLAARTALVLYVALLGFLYVTGTAMRNYGDLVMATLRFGVVAAVLFTENSWQFFYDHFFVVFLDGTIQLAGSFANPSGVFDPNNPWFSLDSLLLMFFAKETHIKIASLLFTHFFFLGAVYIIIFYVIMGMFAIALAKALSLILQAYFISVLLIGLAPLFLVFILFSKTREIFSEWLQQLIAFSIQQILVFAAIGLFAELIISQLERTLGYRVCWRTMFNIFSSLDFSVIQLPSLLDVKFWMPSPSDVRGAIFIDTDHNGVKELLTNRYLDLPYFDPTTDADAIKRYLAGTAFLTATFISLVDMLVFMFSTFIFIKFLDIMPYIADSLKGSGGSRFQSSSLLIVPSGGNNLGKGISGSLWEQTANTLLGEKQDSKSLDGFKNDATGVGKAFYDFTGRDGGLIGNLFRSPFDVANKIRKVGDEKNEEDKQTEIRERMEKFFAQRKDAEEKEKNANLQRQEQSEAADIDKKEDKKEDKPKRDENALRSLKSNEYHALGMANDQNLANDQSRLAQVVNNLDSLIKEMENAGATNVELRNLIDAKNKLESGQ